MCGILKAVDTNIAYSVTFYKTQVLFKGDLEIYTAI